MDGLLRGARALLIAGFATSFMAGAVAAQTISPGQTVNGQLTTSDARSDAGQHQDVYTLRGRAGQVLQISIDGGDGVDPLVRVTGPSNFSAEDDDSGDGLDAALEVTLPANGEYRIVATSFGAGVTGAYTLRVVEARPVQASAIRIGQQVSGALAANDSTRSSGQHQDAYVFSGRAGQTLRVNLDSPEGMDTLVRVTGPGGFSQEDDDSGELLNAQLDITLPANGEYRVIATTYSAGVTGPYTLRVAEIDPRMNAATAAATGAIRVGQTVNGALRAGDPTRSSGQFADAFTFEGQANQTIDVRLSSGAYDPFLSISGPGNFQADNDDDTDSNEPLRNSRLVVTLPQSGTYRIQATSYSSGSTGDYRLSVAQGSGAGATSASASAGQVLAFGETVRGRLQEGDGQLRSGEFSDAFRFLGQAGQRVAIEMRSSEIDTYIIMRSPEGTQTDNDDFEGLGTNSRVELTLEETGEYNVYATTFQPGETGAYEIIVTDLSARREASAPPAAAPSTDMANNQATNGALAASDPTMQDGQHYDLYTFTGRRGQNVSIDLTSSTFDTFLMLVFPSGEGVEDDDGIANTTNSRITAALPADGEYTVVVTSYSAGATGAYSMRMNLGAAGSQAAQPPASSSASAQGGRVFLLSVGISDYGGFASNLSYTADDARNLYTALQSSGSLAQGSAVLTDAQATVANVRAAFQRIAAQAGPNDLFFFFYSGHGSQDVAQGGELDGRDEFLVMRDGLISDNEMAQMYGRVQARLSVIALDSCFSGGFARDVIQSPRIMGLFSSDEDLTSAVAGKFQAGGYLSHFLRTAFEGEADENSDRAITAGELHSYLWRRFASEQNIGAQSMDGERNYQRLVVDRGGVKIDDVVIALGR